MVALREGTGGVSEAEAASEGVEDIDGASSPSGENPATTLRVLGLFALSVVLLVGGAVVATRMSAAPAPPPTTTTKKKTPSPPSPAALAAAQTQPMTTTPSPPPTRPPPREGEALPSLVVLREGKPLELAGPRQKPTLLHLWATWCGPCREELPAILAYGREGSVDVVALSVDDDYAAVLAYFNDKLPPELAWDARIVVEPTMGVRSLPTTIVVDTDGKVRGTLVGAQDWKNPQLRLRVAALGRPQ